MNHPQTRGLPHHLLNHHMDRQETTTRVADLISKHGDHGRGSIEQGPDDPDCPCRGTTDQLDCALAGCGFCTSAALNSLGKDAARWQFFAKSAQTALMLGSDKDPNDDSVDWLEECNRLADDVMRDRPDST